MSEKKHPKIIRGAGASIPAIAPDDPLFTRGWIIGGRVGGPKPAPRPAAPLKKPEERK